MQKSRLEINTMVQLPHLYPRGVIEAEIYQNSNSSSSFNADVFAMSAKRCQCDGDKKITLLQMPENKATNILVKRFLFWNVVWDSLSKLGWVLDKDGNGESNFIALPPLDPDSNSMKKNIDFFDDECKLMRAMATDTRLIRQPQIRKLREEYDEYLFQFKELKSMLSRQERGDAPQREDRNLPSDIFDSNMNMFRYLKSRFHSHMQVQTQDTQQQQQSQHLQQRQPSAQSEKASIETLIQSLFATEKERQKQEERAVMAEAMLLSQKAALANQQSKLVPLSLREEQLRNEMLLRDRVKRTQEAKVMNSVGLNPEPTNITRAIGSVVPPSLQYSPELANVGQIATVTQSILPLKRVEDNKVITTTRPLLQPILPPSLQLKGVETAGELIRRFSNSKQQVEPKNELRDRIRSQIRSGTNFLSGFPLPPMASKISTESNDGQYAHLKLSMDEMKHAFHSIKSTLKMKDTSELERSIQSDFSGDEISAKISAKIFQNISNNLTSSPDNVNVAPNNFQPYSRPTKRLRL